MNLNQFDFVALVPGTKFGSCDLIFPQNWAFHIKGLGPHNALVTGTSPLVCAKFNCFSSDQDFLYGSHE